jgi:putrescine transport system ATP-binding protein
MLAGFETPSSGAIVIDGKDATDIPPNRRPVNMVFQSYAVFPHMTVGENIAYGLKVAGTPKTETARRVAAVLSLVRLEGLAERRPGQLSGGQRQRVALARALVKRPKVLLLDEPLSALDRKLREEMQFELVRLRNETGITFVMVTHDQEEAMSMASRIAVMNRGRIVQIGAPTEVYEHPANRFVAGFLGSVNLFEGTARSATVSGAIAIASPEAGADLLAPGTAQDGTVWLAIRPEKIRLGRTREPADGNALSGEVVEIAYLGERSLFHVRLPAGKLVSVVAVNALRGGPAFRVGDHVGLSWPVEAGTVLAN